MKSLDGHRLFGMGHFFFLKVKNRDNLIGHIHAVQHESSKICIQSDIDRLIKKFFTPLQES